MPYLDPHNGSYHCIADFIAHEGHTLAANRTMSCNMYPTLIVTLDLNPNPLTLDLNPNRDS